MGAVAPKTNKKAESLPLTQYFPCDQIKENEMSGACSTNKGEERCIQGFGGDPDGKRTLGRLRSRWDVSSKLDLKEVGWGHGLDRSG